MSGPVDPKNEPAQDPKQERSATVNPSPAAVSAPTPREVAPPEGNGNDERRGGLALRRLNGPAFVLVITCIALVLLVWRLAGRLAAGGTIPAWQGWLFALSALATVIIVGWLLTRGGLRRPIPKWQAILLGISCIAVVFVAWWLVTRGDIPEERMIGPLTLPSPAETFSTFHRLWFEQELSTNIVVTLRRVTLGFLLAVFIGVPLGIMAGCFPRVNALFMPLVMFGRNIPIAALLPLLIFAVRFDFDYLSANEQRKILFIFVASVAFILADTARAIMDVGQRYVDTAYTLGASRWQTIMKVLVPLAAPTVFGSCRLMFGIAFGYIMLAESIKEAGGVGGLGFQIQMAQRRGDRETIYLIILIIPVIALVVDQLLYWMQRSLFPYQYASDGILNAVVRAMLHGWDDLKRMVFGSRLSEETLARLRSGNVGPEPQPVQPPESQE